MGVWVAVKISYKIARVCGCVDGSKERYKIARVCGCVGGSKEKL